MSKTLPERLCEQAPKLDKLVESLLVAAVSQNSLQHAQWGRNQIQREGGGYKNGNADRELKLQTNDTVYIKNK